MQAPTGKDLIVAHSADARNLAYYKAEMGIGILAPRGWHCFGFYGSGGTTLIVAPEPINSSVSDPHKLAGSGVVLAIHDGDTSGRFQVAEIIARVFPAHQQFVQNVKDLFSDLSLTFPSGPFPSDRLTYKSKSIVEYRTPPQSEGLGTQWPLTRNADLIDGVAIVAGSPAPSVFVLAIRVGPDLQKLAPAIIRHLERETTPKRASN